MELSVIDRIALLSVLPEAGTFLTMKIVRQLRDALYFSEDELAEFGLKQVGQQFTWGKSRSVEVPIGPMAKAIIADALKALDAEGKITDREFTLYERFVEEAADA